MAGDWIKLQKDTPEKPEVLAIASRLGLDPDAVVGKLVRIWSWFDTHTTDGNASCVTFSFVDRITGVTGFAEQVALVGWLTQDGHFLSLPNFDYHNGETAKQRALGKNRAEKSRSNAKSNAPSVTESLPEKRREENIENTDMSPAKLPTCPTGLVIQSYHDHLPTLPTVRLQSEARTKAVSTFWKWVLTSKRADGTPRAETSEQALQWIGEYFNRANDNDFLMGRNAQSGKHANWKADFDFLLTEKGKRHVIEKTGG